MICDMDMFCCFNVLFVKLWLISYFKIDVKYGESFKKKLYEIYQEETETSKTPEVAYTIFLQKFIVLHDNYFPKKILNWK